MFTTYSYKAEPLARIQRNQTYKKIKLKLKKQTKKLIKIRFLQPLQFFYFYFIMVAHVYICLAYFSWIFNERVYFKLKMMTE